MGKIHRQNNVFFIGKSNGVNLPLVPNEFYLLPETPLIKSVKRSCAIFRIIGIIDDPTEGYCLNVRELYIEDGRERYTKEGKTGKIKLSEESLDILEHTTMNSKLDIMLYRTNEIKKNI